METPVTENRTAKKPFVFVQRMDGSPFMPTTRYGWVKRALKSKKAKVVSTLPFIIRLTYEPETDVTQQVAVGIDPGRTNIGVTCVREGGQMLCRTKCETRNKEIPELMHKRKQRRQARRRGERLARKRLAKKLGTTMKGILKRKLPGYGDGRVEVKDIINTEAKSNNRNRPSGWLTPTATQLLRTHLNLLAKQEKLLPVTDVAIELNKFDFVRMDNPKTYKSLYGNGPRKGYGSDHKAISAMQGGRCLYCGEMGIDHIHHLVPVSKGGSESLANKAGLDDNCHNKVHTSAEAAKKLAEIKKGLNKKYAALSVINQIIPYLVDAVAELYPGHTYLTTGFSTKGYRDAYGLGKDHDLDAYCIAMSALGYGEPCLEMPPCYQVKQYRRHNRAKIKSQPYRSYYLITGWEPPKKKGGKPKPIREKVAQNRHPAIEVTYTDGEEKRKRQKFPALDEWYSRQVEAVGEKEAKRLLSSLEVMPSYRRYNDTGRNLPGTIFFYKGKRYLKSGQITNGRYYWAEGEGKTNFPARECKAINNTGLVYVA